MIQDLLQAGDITPNLLGILSGHFYFYLTEVKSRMLVPGSNQDPSQFDLHANFHIRVIPRLRTKSNCKPKLKSRVPT